MKEITIDKEILNKIKENNKLLGSGSFSDCYLYDKNTVIKIYKNPQKTGHIKNCNKESLEFLASLKTSTVHFPHTIVYTDKQISSVLLKYISGVNLNKSLDNSVQIKEILINYEQTLEDILILSKNRIKLDDICGKNIIYNNNGFNLIDNEEACPNDNYSENRCYKETKYYFDTTIIKNILDYNEKSFMYLKEFFCSYEKLREIYNIIEKSDFDFMIFIKALINKYKNLYEEQPVTLEDIKKVKSFKS